MSADLLHFAGTGCPSWADHDAPGPCWAGSVAEVSCPDCRDVLRAVWHWSRSRSVDPWTGEPIAPGSARTAAAGLGDGSIAE